MPIFDYYCNDCVQTHEIIVPLKDVENGNDKKIPCPKCKKPLKKYINKIHLSTKRCTFGY